MGYIPEFENDIFISYAHLDNQPCEDDEKGWVSSFHTSLGRRLDELLGVKSKVWRDEKLQGNDYFDDTISSQLSKAAILVCILSPRYIQSEYCLKELGEFWKAAEKAGTIRIDDKARVFKVVKTHIDLPNHPPELQGLLGYEFYQIDPETGRCREFRPELGREFDRKRWEKIDDLAQDILRLLGTMKSRGKGPGLRVEGRVGATIYLAEATSDLSDAREKVRRELLQRGHTILPDCPLPLKTPDVEVAIRESLSHCGMSIHLIGSNYGLIPEGESRSMMCLQNELAAERCTDPTFWRLIWTPVGLQVKDERQQEYVAHLLDDGGIQKSTEFLQVPLEDLKTVIQDKLKAPQKPAAEPVSEEGPVRIYLICDQQDIGVAEPIGNYLYEQGFEVTLPALEGDETQVREDHEENLRLCDAILLYYGSANDLWLRRQMRDLQKIPAFGRLKPLLAKAIYVGLPESNQKSQFRTHEALAIRWLAPFSPDALTPFLTEVQRRKAGQN